MSSIETLSTQALAIWKESTAPRQWQVFLDTLREHFGVTRTAQARLVTSPLRYEEYKGEIPEDAVVSLLKLPLALRQFRTGPQRLESYAYLLLGDPAADWHLLVWDMRDVEHHWLSIRFLSEQLQAGFQWVQRLNRTEAMLHRDDLTGLYNARYLDVLLDQEIRRAERFASTFGLLFIDLDNFKSVNDRFGHPVGSSALKQIAQVIREAAREVDAIIRYGGDEFIVVLLGASPTTAALAGERMRRRIEECRIFLDDGNHVSLTASIGVACYPAHARNREELLKISDEMMYQGKRKGKNQVTIYEQSL